MIWVGDVFHASALTTRTYHGNQVICLHVSLMAESEGSGRKIQAPSCMKRGQKARDLY